MKMKKSSFIFFRDGMIALICLLCYHVSIAQSWAYVPGITAQDIAVGKNGSVWATGKNSAIYRWTGASWETMSGGAERIAVDPEGAAWVIGSGYIFKYNLATKSWEQKPGMAKDIGVGADGSVWVVGMGPVSGGYDIYKWNGSDWTKITGGGVQIAVEPTGNPWVVDNSSKIFRYNGSSFEQKLGSLKDIGIGANGTIWCTGPDERIYQWSGNNWNLKTGGASWVSVAPDGNAWVVNAAGQVYYTIDAATSSKTLYPRGQTYEYRVLKALGVQADGFGYLMGLGGAPMSYTSLTPLIQEFGQLALAAAEIYAMNRLTATPEGLLTDIKNSLEVRQKVYGILAALVAKKAAINSTDAPSTALRNWATDLFRSIKVRCAKAVLDEYQKWKANPCMYSGEGYKPPPDCGLGHINVAALFTSHPPPEDIIGKSGLKSVLGAGDSLASGIAVAVASAIAAASTIALTSSLGVLAGSSIINTSMATIHLGYTSLFTAFGGPGGVAGASGGAIGAGWAGVVAAPIAAAVLAIVVGTLEGIKVVEAAKVEPMLKMKLGAAMAEYINLTNVLADTCSSQMFFVAFQEAAQRGLMVTPPRVNGEVRFYNQGAYIAQYRLSYTANGQYQELTTPELSVGFEKTYSIPYNATNIKVQGWYLNAGWKDLFNVSLDRPTFVCYTSYGTIFGAEHKVDCPELAGMTSKANQLTVSQGGGYNAWIRLTYTQNGQSVMRLNKSDANSGWREVFDIPSNAINIRLEAWSATGLVWEPWKSIIDKSWPSPPNECIKVYGTSLDPKWNSECK